MNREFESIKSAARHPAEEMLAVAACEDARTASQGCAWLERVGREVARDCRLRYSWWTFSVLARPSLRRFAAAEAAGAEIVLIAAREGPALPEPIREWISLWLNAGPGLRCRVLVACLLPSENDAGTTAGVLAELKAFARRGSLHFFFAKGDEVHPDLIGEVCRPPAIGRLMHPCTPSALPGRARQGGPEPGRVCSMAWQGVLPSRHR